MCEPTGHNAATTRSVRNAFLDNHIRTPHLRPMPEQIFQHAVGPKTISKMVEAASTNNQQINPITMISEQRTYNAFWFFEHSEATQMNGKQHSQLSTDGAIAREGAIQLTTKYKVIILFMMVTLCTHKCIIPCLFCDPLSAGRKCGS